MNRIIALIAGSVIVSFAAACYALRPGSAGEPPQAKASPLTPVVSWAGSYSKVEKRQFLRATTSTEFTELWQRHIGETIEKDSYGEPVVPAIDFNRFMVFAIFRGKAVNTRSELIESIDESESQIRIRFDAQSYQSAGPVHTTTLRPGETIDDAIKRELNEAHDEDEGGANHTTSYGIFVIPRSNKSIVLEENVQSLKDSPAEWKQWIEFPALANHQ